MPGKPHRRGAFWVVGLLCLSLPATAAGKTFEPTRKDDPPPGKCKPNNCSLREAVIAANNRASIDEVRLGKGTYRLTIPEVAGDPNDSSGGDLDLLGDMSVRGRGPARTKISGEDQTRILHPQLTLTDYSVRNLKIRNGIANGGTGGGDGGAILAGNPDGKLTLANVVLDNNAAAGVGGAITSRAGELTIQRSTISGHSASSGGGIYLPSVGTQDPKITIQASTISGNTASAGLGGGIYLDGANTGGIPEDPELTMVNSTVSGNFATVSGGGVATILGSTLSADNSTIAYNISDIDHIGGGSGGGIFQSSNAIATLSDSIVAANSHGGSGDGANCAGSVDLPNTVLGNQPGTACSPTGSFVATDAPLIAGLSDNGGPTNTIALLTGSPAIGLALDCPKRDQRGKLRPGNCDSGSFENKPRKR